MIAAHGVGRARRAGSSSACARSTPSCADVYGPQRIVAEGVVPARVLGGAEYYEPLLTHLRPPGGRWIGIAGFDVVRDEDGTLAVLEDNLRTPSGIAYAVATREAVMRPARARRTTRRRAGSRTRSRSSPRRCAPPRRPPRPTRATRRSCC